jgi:hypothetical protein
MGLAYPTVAPQIAVFESSLRVKAITRGRQAAQSRKLVVVSAASGEGRALMPMMAAVSGDVLPRHDRV